MNFPQAVKTCFRHYASVQGRASRSEFWYFTLFGVLASILCDIADRALFGTLRNGDTRDVLGILLELILFLPNLCVATRRLHDVNRSGQWQFATITIIGIVPLLYWYCKKSDPGRNHYGPQPLK